MYRMDHAFERHPLLDDHGKVDEDADEYFRENVYMTFQDDWVAFQMKTCVIPPLDVANDFPA